jgi:hypothetical protein
MWQSIWQWVTSNKLFEGAAAALLTLIGIIIKKFSKTPDSPARAVSSRVSVPIQINNFPTSPASIGPRMTSAPENSTFDSQRPEIVSIQPRICSVEPHDEYGFIEAVDGKAQIAVATFRRYGDPIRESLHLTAWIRYWNIPRDRNLPLKEIEIARIKNGAWLDEEYNAAIMNRPDTKEVVLAIKAEGELAVVQDNRFGVHNNRGFYIVPIPEDCIQILACLDVVDEKFGALHTTASGYDVSHFRSSERQGVSCLSGRKIRGVAFAYRGGAVQNKSDTGNAPKFKVEYPPFTESDPLLYRVHALVASLFSSILGRGSSLATHSLHRRGIGRNASLLTS